ncbi:MAG: Rid family hydrolase [Solirubrobacteraceae bacterium]
MSASTRWESEEYRDGGRFEELGGYVRAKRVGPFVYVAGTTAVERSGRVHRPGDTAAQARFALQRIDAALRAVGSSLQDVVRTRAYLVEMSDAAAFAAAHREALEDAAPVLTVVGARLATPGLMVEVEVDAIAPDRAEPSGEAARSPMTTPRPRS